MNDQTNLSRWIHCPICGAKTRAKVCEDSVKARAVRLRVARLVLALTGKGRWCKICKQGGIPLIMPLHGVPRRL